MKTKTAICRFCKNTFTKSWFPNSQKEPKFCNHACANRFNQGAVLYDTPHTKSCKECGKSFPKPANRRPKSWAKAQFCSYKCSNLRKAWKGDDVGYSGLHDWIRREWGKASCCQQCGGSRSKSYQWANVSGQYKRERNDWLQLCASCHKRYDLSRA